MTAGIIAGVIIVILALIAATTWLLGTRTKKRLAARHPPPGQMVDMGGYRLHLNCQGSRTDGSPTVVVDAAMGEFSLLWEPIQQQVREFAPICTFDRAGLGWSERSPKPYTVWRSVEELHTLLTRAGVEPPYVLVGHSIGGMNARLYAQKYPDQVVGMVLVDPGHEELLLRWPEGYMQVVEKGVAMGRWLYRLGHWANTPGLLALMPALFARSAPIGLADDARDAYLDIVLSDTRYFQTLLDESSSLEDVMSVLRSVEDPSLGDMPLAVLTAGQFVPTEHIEALQRSGASAEDVAQAEMVRIELQTQLAALSSNGKHVIVEESGHNIHVDQPAFVIDAIREVVEAAWGG